MSMRCAWPPVSGIENVLQFESVALVAAAAALGAAFGGVGNAFVGSVPASFGHGVLPPGLAARGAAGVLAIE